MPSTFLGLAILALAAPGPEPLRIHVKASDRPGVYADLARIKDSVADLQKALSGMKEFVAVPSPAEADVVVTVVDRGQGQRPSGYFGSAGGVQGYDPNRAMMADELWVQVHVDAGAEVAEVIGASPANTWGNCAKDAAKQVKSWAGKNRARILERRSAAPATP